jgi:hypothetical protein
MRWTAAADSSARQQLAGQCRSTTGPRRSIRPCRLESIKTELDANDLLLADYPEVCHPIQALDGIANRCNGQLYQGERTHIGWTAREAYSSNNEPTTSVNDSEPHRPADAGQSSVGFDLFVASR